MPGTADPRAGLLALSSVVGLLAAAFLVMVGGHPWALPMPVAALSVALLVNRRGGPLRTGLAVAQAVLLGLVTLPLMLNGSGVITLIGCIAAVAALAYRDPTPGASMPGWLETRRMHGRRGAGGATPAGTADQTPAVGDHAAEGAPAPPPDGPQAAPDPGAAEGPAPSGASDHPS